MHLVEAKKQIIAPKILKRTDFGTYSSPIKLLNINLRLINNEVTDLKFSVFNQANQWLKQLLYKTIM